MIDDPIVSHCARSGRCTQPLSGRRALVTGAAGGIGRVVVAQLVGLGADVLAAGRDLDALTGLASEFDDAVVPLRLDVTSEPDWSTIPDARVDILVTAAGTTRRSTFVDSTVEDWNALWHTNVVGTLLGIRAVLPGMVSRGYGRIVTISSVGASRGLAGRAAYTATKGAIEAATRSIAAEVGGTGVLLNTLAPGAFPTEMTEAWLASEPEIRDRILSRTIERRLGRAEELGEAIRYLLLSTFTQAATVTVDGGCA